MEAAAAAGMAAMKSFRFCMAAMESKPKAELRSARMPHLLDTGYQTCGNLRQHIARLRSGT